MSTIKVHVDMNLCQSHGECVFAAPDVFELGDDEIEKVIDRLREELATALDVLGAGTAGGTVQQRHGTERLASRDQRHHQRVADPPLGVGGAEPFGSAPQLRRDHGADLRERAPGHRSLDGDQLSHGDGRGVGRGARRPPR